MAGPFSVNTGLILPLTGTLVDTWGEDAVNPDFVALDGLVSGVQTIGVTNAPVTLTAPAGFTATPSPGPTQSQNRVLRFTGTMTGNVRITLPLPGSYLIDNRCTGAFVLSFQGATATEVIAVDQGSVVEIYNDGANVRFVNLGKVAALEFWAGISAMPAWVTACTKVPYLPCDGSTLNYNFSDFPYLAQKMGSAFGGNGITTFGIPDLSGRYPLAYDRGGTRITTAGSGLNGQTMGAVNGASAQSSQLITDNLPPYTPSGTVAGTALVGWSVDQYQPPGGGAKNAVNNITSGSGGNSAILNLTASFAGSPQGGTSVVFSNVPPAQVSGIWVCKT